MHQTLPPYCRTDEEEYQLRITATPPAAREGGGEHVHGEDQLGQEVGGGDGDEEEYQLRSTATPQTAWKGQENMVLEKKLGQGA